MQQPLSVGDEAPDFDLASTEDVVLCLRDEVPRMAMLLYFFADPASERVRQDLLALAEKRGEFALQRTALLGVSPAKLDELKRVQLELDLPFALLHDDRGFSAHYGLSGEEEGVEPDPVLVLVNRGQRIVWLADSPAPVTDLLAAVQPVVESLPSSASNYPRSVVNRIVDWWVNRLRRPRVA